MAEEDRNGARGAFVEVLAIMDSCWYDTTISRVVGVVLREGDIVWYEYDA